MDLRCAVALSLLSSPSRFRIQTLLPRVQLDGRHESSQAGDRGRQAGPPAEVLLASILESLGPGPGTPDPDGQARLLLKQADVALARAAARDIQPVAWYDRRYPALLTAISDPPPVLWIRGQLAIFESPAVALVGSRAASAYALEVAAGLAEALSRRGIAVVSGLARGVDAAAHRGAVAGGGRTVGILGCGVDVVYPAEHASLAAAVLEQGALVSELLPGTPPRPYHFPRRNRLISGLARAVVVVEASERSGSLITARCALEQGREVMAVPGNVLSGRSRGAHALIRDGAKLVEQADDIVEELGLGLGAPGAATVPAPLHGQLLSSMERGESYTLDALAERSGLDAAELLTRLLELEITGRISRIPGGRFVRSSRTC